MTDTHRSGIQFRSLLEATRAAFATIANPVRVGDKTGEVRDALNTQTTDQNSAAWQESVAGVLRLLHGERMDPAHDDEAPPSWRAFYIEALEDVADRLALPRDSGKSGDGAAIAENRGDHAPDVANGAVRPENPDVPGWVLRVADLERERDRLRDTLIGVRNDLDGSRLNGQSIVDTIWHGPAETTVDFITAALDAEHAPKFHLPKPHVPAFDEAAHYAAVGMLKEEGEDEPDRTPEQQAATFRAMTDEPRPTAVAIKAALENLSDLSGLCRQPWVGRLDDVASVLDRLGIHCLALEIKRDDLAGQLDRIAAQAKPVDGTDLAELCQKAREASGYIGRGGLWFGSSGTMHGRSIGGAETANMIDRLVAAVNDQARRLREAETAQDADGLIAESYRAVSELIRHNTDPGTSAWSNLVSRMRWALVQQGKARRTYTDEQRDTAKFQLAGAYPTDGLGDAVDSVAEALGLERAK